MNWNETVAIKLSISRIAFLTDFPSRGTEVDLVGKCEKTEGKMGMGAKGETKVSRITQEMERFH